jgi:hypothetical protein
MMAHVNNPSGSMLKQHLQHYFLLKGDVPRTDRSAYAANTWAEASSTWNPV